MPSLSPEKTAERLEAVKRLGPDATIVEIARDLTENGHRVSASSLTHWIRERGGKEAICAKPLDPGIEAALAATGVSASAAKFGYRRVESEDGSFDTVFWRLPEAQRKNVLDEIRNAFDGLAPASPIRPPKRAADDLCNVIPLYDVHWGMKAWGQETGGADYDLKLAAADIIRGFDAVLDMTAQADTAVLLIGGDFYHADDNTAQTPKSRHSLDVDNRMHKVISSSIEVISHVIEQLAARHRKVRLRILRGNHDEHSHMILSFALQQRYRKIERIEIDMSPMDLFQFQWGDVGIFGHHGDRGSVSDFAHRVADVCRFWSDCPHRFAYLGHKHKLEAQRVGGLYVERLDPVAPPDAYGATWAGRRVLKIDGFHKRDGRVMTVYNPLSRLEAA